MKNNSFQVLIVDDEADLCEILSSSLTNLGFDCKTALNGEEALELIKNHEFHALLTDYHMPKISGIELISKVKNDFPNMFCVIMMTDASEEEIKSVQSHGVDRIISKPFDLDDIDNLFDTFRNEKLKASAI
ncbi:MAG: response regulator [Bdellovibrionales bacterium]|nr:response regulator [Bdellovibrionales bacterium]